MFAAPRARALETLRAANAIAGAIAERQRAIVWDEETREAFSAAAWHERRIAGWPDDTPDVSKQMTMHAYQEGEFVRIVTLGMTRFGLPDLVVEQCAWSEVRSVGNLINVTAQALVEGAEVDGAGTLHLDLKSLRNAAARDAQLRTLKRNATGTAEITVANVATRPGDAANRLLRLGADRYPGDDDHARQTALLAGLFGSEDRIDRLEHDAEVLAASRRAREQLPRLREAWKRGLEPGEHILVKAPFKTTEGTDEWM
jgi:hypothetical protein